MKLLLLVVSFVFATLSQSCSDSTLRSFSGSKGQEVSSESQEEIVTSEDAISDRQEYPTENVDVDVTAIPPQIVTGAYLVCSEADVEAISEFPDGFPQAEHQVISCGVQTQAREKHPAETQFSSVVIGCKDREEELNPNTMEAPTTSKWHVFSEYADREDCEVESIVASLTIDGKELILETSLTDNALPMPPLNYHLMFVTSKAYPTGTAYPEGFDSVDSADMLCADHAKLGGVTSYVTEWKAILSSNTVAVRDRMTIYEDVFGVNMALLYKTGRFWSKLLSAVPDENNVLFDPEVDGEDDAENATPDVWTGSKDSGEKSGDTCEGWTDNTEDKSSKYGNLEVFGGKEWIADDKEECDESLRLYCVSQFELPPASSRGARPRGK